jgi:anti-sigma B factor antagonist
MVGAMATFGRWWRGIVRRRRSGGAAVERAAGPLTVETVDTGVATMLVVSGEVDLATAPALRDALAARPGADGESVGLDLSGVTFMDSIGLALVLSLWREVRARGGRLAVVCPEGPARLLFDVTGVDTELELYPTREAAVEALRA